MDELLNNVVPKAFVQMLQRNQNERFIRCYDSLAMIQTDFVSFTSFAATIDSGKLISIVNAFFITLDQIAVKFGIEKIKSAGDSLLFVDLVVRQRDLHVIRFGLALQSGIEKVNAKMRLRFRMRVGVARDSGVVGVIGGHNSITFDCYGPVTRTATILESQCLPMHVHASSSMLEQLLQETQKDDADFVVVSQSDVGIMIKSGETTHSHQSSSLPDSDSELDDSLPLLEEDIKSPASCLVVPMTILRPFDENRPLEGLVEKNGVDNSEADDGDSSDDKTTSFFRIIPLIGFSTFQNNVDFWIRGIGQFERPTRWLALMTFAMLTVFAAAFVITEPQTHPFMRTALIAYSSVAVSLLLLVLSLVVVVIPKKSLCLGCRVAIVAVVSILNGFVLVPALLFSYADPTIFEYSAVSMARNTVIIQAIFLMFSYVWIPWIFRVVFAGVVGFSFAIVWTVQAGSFEFQAFLYVVLGVVVEAMTFYTIQSLDLNNFRVVEMTNRRLRMVEKMIVRNDVLLESFLPPFVVKELKILNSGSTVDEADVSEFESVVASTIRTETVLAHLFPKISGYIKDGAVCFVQIHAPESIETALFMGFLLRLFNQFDDAVAEFNTCTKVKSLNRTYILLARNSTQSLRMIPSCHEAIASCALRLMKEFEVIRSPFLQFLSSKEGEKTKTDQHSISSGFSISCTIGVHAGSFHQGIVGKTKYLYDIFGDPVVC